MKRAISQYKKYHNTLCLSLQNFALAVSSFSLGLISNRVFRSCHLETALFTQRQEKFQQLQKSQCYEESLRLLIYHSRATPYTKKTSSLAIALTVRHSVSTDNRQLSRWRHLTTTTRIQFVFLFLFKFCIPSGVKITIPLSSMRQEKRKQLSIVSA